MPFIFLFIFVVRFFFHFPRRTIRISRLAVCLVFRSVGCHIAASAWMAFGSWEFQQCVTNRSSTVWLHVDRPDDRPNDRPTFSRCVFFSARRLRFNFMIFYGVFIGNVRRLNHSLREKQRRENEKGENRDRYKNYDSHFFFHAAKYRMIKPSPRKTVNLLWVQRYSNIRIKWSWTFL